MNNLNEASHLHALPPTPDDASELNDIDTTGTQKEVSAIRYKTVVQGGYGVEATAGRSADLRYVEHGRGPCACCGPYGE